MTIESVEIVVLVNNLVNHLQLVGLPGTGFHVGDILLDELVQGNALGFLGDGARLGYGLASPECDLTLPELAELCDVFYIGGTKVGALCGEAVVFPEPETAPAAFFTIIKQHGALLAKGRLLGIQFDALFSDGLYMNISCSAIEKAMRVKSMFQKKGIPFHIDSPTNQQFPILTKSQIDSLKDKVMFEIWEKLPGGRSVTRFATSWATTEAQLDELESYISNL